jgi:hypothetical protein
VHRRLYCQDNSNVIVELCDDGNGWFVSSHKFPGALPRTGIAAAHWWNSSNSSSHLRLYYQETQNTILERCYDTPFWTKGHTFSGVASSTGIAAVGWLDSDQHLRVYYEDTTKALIEQCYDNGEWTRGTFVAPAN